MTIFELWKKIGVPENVVSATLELDFNDKIFQNLYPIYQRNHELFFQNVLLREDSALWFFLIYSHMACKTYDKYLSKGISEEIFFDTFRDITYWCENYEREYGKIGLGAYDWFQRHIDMTLFRLGRLQFETMTMEHMVGCGEKSILEGTPIINIHIPQGEPLIWSECEKSIKEAQKIWGNKIPYVCHSWILYPELKDVLSENSNIREFSSHFDIIEIDFKEREAEWRIFGKVLKNISDYPEKTKLQKSAKNYLLNGKCLGCGFGILNL